MVEPSTGGGVQELAYELSRAALGRQEDVMNELRARTGTLLAASSIVASFLGGRASDEGTGVFTVLALVAFVGSVGASIYVLAPKDGLIFALRGSVLFEAEQEDPGGLPETHRRLAYWLESFYDENPQDNSMDVSRLLGRHNRGPRPSATLGLRTRFLTRMANKPSAPPPPPPNLGIPETKGGNDKRETS